MEKLSTKDKTIHDQFSAYGRNAKEWMNKCILLLPQVEKNQIWAKKGFSNIYEYARKLAGMSRNKVNESLRILGKTENLPAIRKMIEQKGIFAVKPVVNIVTSETEEFWAKRVSEMNKNTLETFVRDYRKEHEYADGGFRLIGAGTIGRPGAGHPAEKGLNKPNNFQECSGIFSITDSKINISIKVEPEVLAALKKIKGDNDWNFIMKKMLKSYQKEIEAEQRQFQAELMQEKPAAVKTNNHAVTATIKKYIIKRSKGICEHQNCKKPGVNIHHTEPFALRKVHDPDKLVHLCEEHHQIIHFGYIDDSSFGTASWKQIEKLPSYDIKNIINQRISEFKH